MAKKELKTKIDIVLFIAMVRKESDINKLKYLVKEYKNKEFEIV